MRYKILGRSGLRVSEICLGTMTFGTEWGWGADKTESRRQFDAFIYAGGNFIDTANRYTNGTSEQFLGDFIRETGTRDEIVMATKFSLYNKEKTLNDGGNHRKNLVRTLEGSLKRLKMDYVDILYVHAWDFSTPVEEVMRALEDVVKAGKVLHIAVSDTPAWVVSKANTVADFRGWSQFIAMQIEYSLITRDGERDLIPMANDLDIAVTAWAPLAGGALTGKYLKNPEEKGRVTPESKRRNEASIKIAKEVSALAEGIGCSPAHVALKWVMNKNVIPIVGARTSEQLEDNLKSKDIVLNEEQMIRLDEVSKIELGFPHEFLQGDVVSNLLYGGMLNKIDFKRRV